MELGGRGLAAEEDEELAAEGLLPLSAQEELRPALAARGLLCVLTARGRSRAVPASLALALFAGAAALAALTSSGGHGERAQASTDSVQQLDDLNCTGFDQDCGSTRCCQQAGQTCFEKNDLFATCFDSCEPGVHEDGKEWTCKSLGARTPFPAGCAWPGEDCGGSGSCCNRGWQCAVKDSGFAGCTQVEFGPWTNDAPASTKPIPADWEGKVLGSWRSEYKVAPRPDGLVAKTTLFCFFAVLAGSPEIALVDAARVRKASIFGCEDYSIYDSAKSKFHTWDTGVSTLVNTAAFVKVWDQVRTEGKYLKQDWTVKVDADCVFFPARLRLSLEALKPPAYTPIYVKNTMTRFMAGAFLGAIEVLSKMAVETYLDNSADCIRFIGTLSGEDGFIKDCLDSLGVGHLHDEAILHPSPIPIDCQVTEFAAFHPFKSVGDYTYCYDIAVGNSKPPGPLPPGSVEIIPEYMRAKYQQKSAAR